MAKEWSKGGSEEPRDPLCHVIHQKHKKIWVSLSEKVVTSPDFKEGRKEGRKEERRDSLNQTHSKLASIKIAKFVNAQFSLVYLDPIISHHSHWDRDDTIQPRL